jgi:uncharacterized protein
VIAADDIELLRRAWAAFAAGDVDAATEALDPRVRWYGAGEPDGAASCHSRDDAIAFIRRAIADGVTAELCAVRAVGDRLVATVQEHVPAAWGEQPPAHGEVVTVRDGRIVEIVVYATVDHALAAACGRGPNAPPSS